MENQTSRYPPLAVPPELNMAVLDALPSHIALLDSEGRIVAVNAAWRRFATENSPVADQQAPRSDIGADYFALCEAAVGAAAEGASEAAAGIRAVLARQAPVFNLEYACHGPNHPRWFEMTASPLELTSAAAIIVHTDITPRKQEELSRRDNELRLQLALDASGHGLWDWDLRTGLAFLSPHYYTLTGYRPEEVTPNLAFFLSLIHPDDLPAVQATMAAHLRGETPDSVVEYRLITADNTIRWISGRGRVVMRDAQGAPLRMTGYITDITELKQVELALHASEARYRAVVDAQSEVISRIQADGTILFANDAYCRYFGKPAAELLGRKWQPVAHPDDLEMIEARLRELTPANPVVTIENRVFDAHGVMRWSQFLNRGFFDADGHLIEIQAVGRDVTERRQLEDLRRQLLEENTRLGHELVRLQEVERAALARELHDTLSQHLAAIRAYAGAIERRIVEPGDRSRFDAQAISRAAGEIYANSHRLMEGLHPQALDSAGLIAAIDGLIRHWMQTRPETHVRLCTRLSDDPSPADMRIHLFRIVQECLANAFSHAQAKRIRIHVGIRQGHDQRCLRIVVSDDGAGLPPNVSPAGYGLIAMRERVNALAGSLELRSRPGRGLRVAVTVPLPG